ncbi:MAG: CHAP domain-containing protein, partial [Isosphaeraceae bacterium]
MTGLRKIRKFRPSLDGLESRQVLSTLAAAPPAFVAARTPMVSIKADLNTRVLSFAKSKVGDGECATLADEAVRLAGGKRFYQLGSTGSNADYVWGRKITTLTPSSGSISSIKPGDIIQFRNVTFRQDTKITRPSGSTSTSYKTSSYGHHTAVVESVSGNNINLLQQN